LLTMLAITATGTCAPMGPDDVEEVVVVVVMEEVDGGLMGGTGAAGGGGTEDGGDTAMGAIAPAGCMGGDIMGMELAAGGGGMGVAIAEALADAVGGMTTVEADMAWDEAMEPAIAAPEPTEGMPMLFIMAGGW